MTTMFIAALFIIARSWKEPRCPSVDEWLQKLWYIYIMEYYSAIRNNDFMKFLGKWMYFQEKNIILSEITQSKKNRHNIQSLIIGYQPQKALNTQKKVTDHMKLKKRKAKKWKPQSFIEKKSVQHPCRVGYTQNQIINNSRPKKIALWHLLVFKNHYV